MRILIVEHDLSVANGLTLLLKPLSAAIDQTDTGEEAVELARLYDYDVVLLALMLPDIDGYEVVRRLRAGRIETPVLVLSEISRPEASVKALRMGADDFIIKPFDKAELLARVQAVIRRSKGHSQPIVQIGPMALHLDSREVTVSGKPVSLTGKEYNILELLTLRKGMVLSKDVFLNHLYGGIDEPEAKIIDVFICKIRKKLASAGCENLIVTVWGQGYVLRDPAVGAGRLPAWRVAAASAQQSPLPRRLPPESYAPERRETEATSASSLPRRGLSTFRHDGAIGMRPIATVGCNPTVGGLLPPGRTMDGDRRLSGYSSGLMSRSRTA